ncbi:MAG: hypothetical protein ABSD46_09375 [Bacteroidota bacterium]
MNMPLLALGVLVVIILLFYFIRKSQVKAWSELAAQTGLLCEAGNPLSPIRVIGKYRNRNLVMETFRTSSKNTDTCTRIIVGVNNTASLRLTLTEENILTKIGKKLGGQDIQTGNDAIDKRFIIKGEPETKIQQLLASFDVCQMLLSTPLLMIEIVGGEIRYEQYVFEKNVKRLQRLFDLLCLLAEGVEKIN